MNIFFLYYCKGQEVIYLNKRKPRIKKRREKQSDFVLFQINSKKFNARKFYTVQDWVQKLLPQHSKRAIHSLTQSEAEQEHLIIAFKRPFHDKEQIILTLQGILLQLVTDLLIAYSPPFQNASPKLTPTLHCQKVWTNHELYFFLLFSDCSIY